MRTLTLFSPAKLNLFLHITGQRPDGYHDLQSVFRAIDFGDTLTFRTARTTTLIGADGLTDNIADNLILKAVNLLKQHYPAYSADVQIILEKRLPTGAGLGGGSSNAAATLIAVSELWGLRLSATELMRLGAKLGADVPFFIFTHFYKSPAIATGIGEHLTPISLPACDYLLLLPQTHSSTATLFNHPELIKNTPIIDDSLLKNHIFDRLDGIFFNAFEPLVCQNSPLIKEALDYLKTLESHTHTTARLTGTGAAVFLPLPALDDRTKAAFIGNAPCPAMIVSSLT